MNRDRKKELRALIDDLLVLCTQKRTRPRWATPVHYHMFFAVKHLLNDDYRGCFQMTRYSETEAFELLTRIFKNCQKNKPVDRKLLAQLQTKGVKRD